MNLAELHRKLINAARANRPSDRVPFAFEKRIMARLTAKPLLDVWAVWSRGLWRAVAPCLTVMFLFGAWSYLNPVDNTVAKAPTKDLSQDFENTLLAAVVQDSNNNSW